MLWLGPCAWSGGAWAGPSGAASLIAAPDLDPVQLAFIQGRLDSERPAATAWWTTWVVALGTAASVQAVGALSLKGPQFEAIRPQLGVGAVSAAIGCAGLLVLMPSPLAWSGGVHDLPAAKRRLRLISDSEVLGHSWAAHLAAVAVNGAGALVMSLVFHDPVSAAVGFIVGMSVAELQIYTHPTQGIADALDAERWSVATWP